MWQQGQVFKLKAKGRDGQPLWAYRYRLEGRGSVRPQVGSSTAVGSTESSRFQLAKRPRARTRLYALPCKR